MDVALGVIAPYADGVITSSTFVADFAGVLEECEVESVWAVEHVVEAEVYEPLYPYNSEGKMPGRYVPMTDPLETLAYLAAVTSTVKLGTAVVVAPLHSPAVLAKRATTLDWLSDHRLILGLGIGWQKEEYAAVGVPYADRGRRLEECIEAMRELWTLPSGHLPRSLRRVRRGALVARAARAHPDRSRWQQRTGDPALRAVGQRLVPVDDQSRRLRGRRSFAH